MQFDKWNDGKDVLVTYPSLEDFVEHVKANRDKDFTLGDRDFYGTSSWKKAFRMAENGLPVEGVAALDSAVERAETMIQTVGPRMRWTNDVAGEEVSIDRYLTGEPEHFFLPHVRQESGISRVISLSATVSTPWHVSTEAIRKRGVEVVAAAIALDGIGFQSEIWAEPHTCFARVGEDASMGFYRSRVLVKAASAILDPGALMFALTSAVFSRALGFGAATSNDKATRDLFGAREGAGFGYSYDSSTVRVDDYEENTFMVPPLRSDRDADRDIVHEVLASVGLIEGEEQ